MLASRASLSCDKPLATRHLRRFHPMVCLMSIAHEHCFEHGVLVRPVANTIVLSPPLTIGEHEVETIFATIEAALKAD